MLGKKIHEQLINTKPIHNISIVLYTEEHAENTPKNPKINDYVLWNKIYYETAKIQFYIQDGYDEKDNDRRGNIHVNDDFCFTVGSYCNCILNNTESIYCRH